MSQPTAEEHVQAPVQSGESVREAVAGKPAQPIKPPIPAVRHVTKEQTPEQGPEEAAKQPGGKGGRPPSQNLLQ